MSARVTVSRPDSENVRVILLDGSPVGRIRQTAYTGHKWCATVQVPRTAGNPDGTRDFAGRVLGDVLDFARSFEGYPAQRWVYMSGSHGCMPDSRGCCATREDAIESLRELFSLGGRRTRELRSSGYLELRTSVDGASYCEILPCACAGCAGMTIGAESDSEIGCCNE